MIAATLDRPGADVQDLRALRDQAPDPGHMPSYTRLVRAGATYRDLAAYADRATGQTTTSPDSGTDPDLTGHDLNQQREHP